MFEEYPEAAGLLAAIRELPDEPTARLVLADWLEDHGDERAGWLRDELVWPWMRPDLHDPIPALLAHHAAASWSDTATSTAALARLGPSATAAVRAWVRDHGQFWLTLAPALRTLRPRPLRPVNELLRARSLFWTDGLFAIIDLGHHGPAAAPAVAEMLLWLEQEAKSDSWPGIELCHALVRIGPPAGEAYPVLLAVNKGDGHLARAAAEALSQLLPHCHEAILAVPEWQNHVQAFLLGMWGIRGVAAEGVRILRRRPQVLRYHLDNLLEAFQSPQNGDRHEIRYEVALALATLGPQARAAEPALRKALANYDLFVPSGGYAEAAHAAIRAALAALGE